MESKYMVTVKTIGNPEFSVTDKRIEEGLEATGVILILFNEETGKGTEMISGISNMDLAEYLASDEGEAATILRESLAIADGLIKAKEIRGEHKKKKILKDLTNRREFLSFLKEEGDE